MLTTLVEPLSNLHLWIGLLGLLFGMKDMVRWLKAPAHMGIEGNEVANSRAVACMCQSCLWEVVVYILTYTYNVHIRFLRQIMDRIWPVRKVKDMLGGHWGRVVYLPDGPMFVVRKIMYFGLLLGLRSSWGPAQMPVTQKVTGGENVLGSSWADGPNHVTAKRANLGLLGFSGWCLRTQAPDFLRKNLAVRQIKC